MIAFRRQKEWSYHYSCHFLFAVLVVFISIEARGVKSQEQQQSSSTSSSSEVVAVSVVPNPVHICHILFRHPIGTTSAAHAHFTVGQLSSSSEFAPAAEHGLHFNYSLILGKQGNIDVRDTLQSVLDVPTGNCTIFLGPSTSVQSLAISPIIDRPWISDTASSTELSDKDSHPWFSRTTPTNIIIGGSVGEVVTELFEWDSGLVICGDDTYGRSLVDGFDAAMRKKGGRVEHSECVAPTDEEAVEKALRKLSASNYKSRVLMVAAFPEDTIIDKIVELGMHKEYVLVLTEVACQDGSATPLKVPGALCPLYGIQERIFQSYKTLWDSHPEGTYTGMKPTATTSSGGSSGSSNSSNSDAAGTQQEGLFSDTSLFEPMPSEYVIHGFAALSRDMTHFAMAAYQNMLTSSTICNGNITCFNSLTREQQRDYLRSDTFIDGLTGPYKMTPTGDRLGAVMAINNIQPNGVLKPIANWNELDGVTDLRPGHGDESQLYWLASGFQDPPAGTFLPPPEEKGVPTLLVVGLFSAACLLLVIVIAVYKLRKAGKLAYSRLLRSGTNWMITAGLVSAAADLLTDLVACYSVLNAGNYGFTFQLFFSLLTGLAVVVSIADIQLMIRFFVRTLNSAAAEGLRERQEKKKKKEDRQSGEEDEVQQQQQSLDLESMMTPDEIADWKISIQKGHIVSLVAEDIPMATIGIVATLTVELNTFVVISLIFSLIGIGWKMHDIPTVWRFMFRDVEEDQSVEGDTTTAASFYDGGAQQDVHTNKSDNAPGEESDLPTTRPGSAAVSEISSAAGLALLKESKQFGQFTDPRQLEIFADYLEQKFPKRSRVLSAKAEQMIIELALRKVSKAEFYATINPVLQKRFAGDTKQLQQERLGGFATHGANPLTPGGGAIETLSSLEGGPTIVDIIPYDSGNDDSNRSRNNQKNNNNNNNNNIKRNNDSPPESSMAKSRNKDDGEDFYPASGGWVVDESDDQ